MTQHNILWTDKEAAAITGGKSNTLWMATGVCLKLADIRPGDLFFASPEDNLDAVFARGAAAAVVSSPSHANTGYPLLFVSDVFEALRALARAARFKTHGVVIAAQGGIRGSVFDGLSVSANVYEGGRHLSMGMAGMPENCCYGVFGFSPSVRPDVAIIDDCQAAMNSTMLESLPDNGVVIINCDDEAFLDVFAKAKSYGTRSIFTYGSSPMADAKLQSSLEASNGVRLQISLLGQGLETIIPAGRTFNSQCLAGLILLQLMNYPVARDIHAIVLKTALSRENLDAGNALFMSSDADALGPSESIFRVKNTVDLGNMGRTAVLESFNLPADKTMHVTKNDLEIPAQVGSLNLVYACKTIPMYSNARSELMQQKTVHSMHEIVPDVLAPGDFVVFKQLWKASKNVFSEAIRVASSATPAREA